MTTPYARLLRDLGDRCEAVDSWTGRAEQRAGGTRLHPAAARVLRKWGEGIRDGLAGLGPNVPEALERAVKRTYKDATGGLQREGMRIWRPDWAHTIIDLWRATLYRRILAVHETLDIWPCRVATDSISYASSSGDPGTLAKAIGVRPGLGSFKHELTVTAATWAYLQTKKGRR